jgi:hypothetical protein
VKRGRHFSGRGLARAAVWSLGALILPVLAYVGLVQVGALASPFAPKLHGDVEQARSDGEGLRVLFVGNSFTFGNSMPELVDELLSGAENRPVHVVEYAAPMWSLREAASDGGLRDLLRDVEWDLVVLQEASRLASLPRRVRDEEMYPYLDELVTEIRSAGARPILFMTWGYERGDREVPGDTFGAMEARLEEGFREQAARLSIATAPVGPAWAEALRGRPGLDLWEGDGRHPALAGSYLAACVFSALITGADPSRSDFAAGLDPNEARYLRAVAAAVVGA